MRWIYVKEIAIVLLGGTIACTVNEKNECIVISMKDFCSRFRELNSYDIIVHDFRQLSGAETWFSDMIDVANEVKRLIGEEQANGVVVVQGTNLMEEMAFGLDILLQTDVPVVCTEAMRPATCSNFLRFSCSRFAVICFWTGLCKPESSENGQI